MIRVVVGAVMAAAVLVALRQRLAGLGRRLERLRGAGGDGERGLPQRRRPCPLEAAGVKAVLLPVERPGLLPHVQPSPAETAAPPHGPA